MQLNEYLTWHYDGIGEIQQIMLAEQPEFDGLEALEARNYKNRFVKTADETGVERYEQLVEVRADPMTETMEFRKARIVNRLTILPPLTMIFLRERLDQILGAGNWEIEMRYNEYHLIITALMADRQWLNELRATLERIKPCNIVVNYHQRVHEEALAGLWFGAVPSVRVACEIEPVGQLP